MMTPMEDNTLRDLLRLNAQGYLHHRERSDLEYKESFNFAGLAEYFRDFAAFANNKGGYLIFGVQNSPRSPEGMSERAASQFEQIDQETISGYLNDLFSPEIIWEQCEINMHGKNFGVFYVYESRNKPVIAKKDEGRGKEIKNGEIYYRYAGRTQKIEYSELEQIISERTERTNKEWMSLMSKIGKIGPSNAAILDTEEGIIEKDEGNVLVIDKDLLPQIKFIREGEFSQKKGATALKVVGDVQPVDQVEVTKILRKDLNDLYPYTYTEMTEIIKSNIEGARLSKINAIIKDNDLKNDPRYSAYRFMSKKHQDQYEKEGILTSSTSTIYNENAIEFIYEKLSDER